MTTGNQGLYESREERSNLVCGVMVWAGERIGSHVLSLGIVGIHLVKVRGRSQVGGVHGSTASEPVDSVWCVDTEGDGT